MNKYPIKHRNHQLHNLFCNLGFDVRLIGDHNQPKIIIDNSFAVSGFVKNRIFNFTTKPFGGEVIRSVNLNTPNISKREIDILFSTNSQRPYYKIHLINTKLYYLKTENAEPLFSVSDSRFFFDKHKATKTIEYLKNLFDLNLELKTYTRKNLDS